MGVQFWGQELAELEVLWKDAELQRERKDAPTVFARLSTLFEKRGWHLIGAGGFGLVHSQEFAEHTLVGHADFSKMRSGCLGAGFDFVVWRHSEVVHVCLLCKIPDSKHWLFRRWW